LVTPRSARSMAKGFEFIGLPRSACRVICSSWTCHQNQISLGVILDYRAQFPQPVYVIFEVCGLWHRCFSWRFLPPPQSDMVRGRPPDENKRRVPPGTEVPSQFRGGPDIGVPRMGYMLRKPRRFVEKRSCPTYHRDLLHPAIAVAYLRSSGAEDVSVQPSNVFARIRVLAGERLPFFGMVPVLSHHLRGLTLRRDRGGKFSDVPRARCFRLSTAAPHAGFFWCIIQPIYGLNRQRNSGRFSQKAPVCSHGGRFCILFRLLLPPI